jgi:hypothetical protein
MKFKKRGDEIKKKSSNGLSAKQKYLAQTLSAIATTAWLK